MMAILLFIKHRLTFLWRLAEWGNGVVFKFRFRKRLLAAIEQNCERHNGDRIFFSVVSADEIPRLAEFFASQPRESYQYFKPHAFDVGALSRLNRNPAFFMLTVKDEGRNMIGYFMIRGFCNHRAFAGFLVGAEARGKGLAQTMGNIIFQSCWECGFRVFATVSQKNKQALSAYRKINDFVILKELPDDYIYIEYLQAGAKTDASLQQRQG